MVKKTPIGKLLLQKQKISEANLNQALEHQHASGKKLASSLLNLGLAAEEDLLLALGEQFGMPVVDLARSIIPLRFSDIVPQPVAETNGVLPLLADDRRVVLAMADPEDKKILDEIGFITGKKVEPYLALEARLRNTIQQIYATRKRDPSVKFFFGERTSPSEEGIPEDGHLELVTQILPEPELVIEVEQPEGIEDENGEEQSAFVDDSRSNDKRTILVVDDEVDICRMLQKALNQEGFEVVCAERGLEALQTVKATNPDLMILDAMLPEIHGFEICKKIKNSRRFSHIPVIIVSAVYRGWRYAEDVKQTYGADDYFEKPFRIVPLVRRVRELLQAGPPRSNAATHSKEANEAYQSGIAFYKQKQYNEAETQLRKAVELDPFSATIHYALANVLLTKNNIYEAIREYEHTIELKSDLFVPLKNLAILYQKKGFRNKAVEMWERAMRVSPDEKIREEVRHQLLKLL